MYTTLRQITARIHKLSYGLDLDYVDPVEYVLNFYHF